MLARTCLSLTLCLTSTLAAAKEPAQRAEGPLPPTLARRDAEPQETSTSPAPAARRNQPDLTPASMKRDWQTEHRWLQAGTGISWVLVGLGTIGTIVPLTTLRRCNTADAAGADIDCSLERRTAAITTPIVGLLTVAALVPAIMFTTRLARHRSERPVARLRPAAGGLAVDF